MLPEPLFIGVVSSILPILLVAGKWRIALRSALAGAIVSALTAAIPFVWLYPMCKTVWETAVGMFAQVGLALAIAFILTMQRFGRDPERIPPAAERAVLSAADGKVIYIKMIDRDSVAWVTKDGRDYLLPELMGVSLVDSSVYVIGVEMNILNVHVNRCPIAGQVKIVNPIEGKFMSLRKEEAPFVNARCTTVIENEYLSVGVVQVASRLVRRVENYLGEHQTVSAGQRLGMIRFGSLVAVVLPKREDVKVEMRVGDNVIAGVSILARY